MTVIEYLASRLDREMTQVEIDFGDSNFLERLDFLALCLQAKELLLEERKREKDVADKQ
jgi:hypothetical protein